MKNKKMMLIVTIFTIVLLSAYMFNTYRSYSFQKVVFNYIDKTKLTSVDITKESLSSNSDIKKVQNDSNSVQAILDSLSGLELRKATMFDVDYSETYEFIFKKNQQRELKVVFYKDNYLTVSSIENNSEINGTYKITNNYNQEWIEGFIK